MGDQMKGNFSTLQHLLQQAYSEDAEKQQKAAMELSKLVDGKPFPAVSFGPLTHALCKLVPSKNRSYVLKLIWVVFTFNGICGSVAVEWSLMLLKL